MKPRFKGKIVLVTGAGSGIGEKTALAFGREGATVAVNDLRPARATATAIVAQVEKRFRRLDILVNNAGTGVAGTALTTSESDWDRLMRVNVKSMFLLSKAALPGMIRRKKGVIINTASIAGVAGLKDRAAYAASKHAVVGLTAIDRKSTRLNSSHPRLSRMPSSA